MKYKKIHLNVPDLKKHSAGAAGYDLYTAYDITYNSKPFRIYTGVSIQLPKGHVGLLTLRSSAGEYLFMPDGIGIIDSDYRGHITLLVMCKPNVEIDIKKHERIGQIVIVPCFMKNGIEVQELSITERGERGFGSTGR